MRKQWILFTAMLLLALPILSGCNSDAETPSSPTEQAATAVAAIEATREQRLTETPTPAGDTAPSETPAAQSTGEPLPESQGDLIAFWRDNGSAVDIIILDPDTGEELNLTNNTNLHAFRPIWSPDRLFVTFVYDKEDNWDLYYMPADGSARLPREMTVSPNPDLYPQWSPDGQFVTYYHFADGQFDVYREDFATHFKANLTNDTPDSSESHATWSPDGQDILFISDRDGNDEYYLMSRDGWNLRRLTESEGSEWDAAWSPDGSQIAFVSDRDGDAEIYVMDADGSNPRRMTNDPAEDGIPTWSPDGRSLLFASNREGNAEIYWVDAACLESDAGCDEQAVNLTQDPGEDSLPSWSPDGNRIAFVSTRVDGVEDIFLMEADGSGLVNLTETAGAQEWGPVWAPRPPVE